MPSVLPLGDPAPSDGLLPPQAADGAAGRAFGLYVHIPFCAVRCGYCDFNTYTATELGGGASQDAYASTAVSEVDFAAAALRASGIPDRPMSTVFFGGGTPTLLPAEDLARILAAAVGRWGLEPGAEVTTEANPDSVTPEAYALSRCVMAENASTCSPWSMRSTFTRSATCSPSAFQSSEP